MSRIGAVIGITVVLLAQACRSTPDADIFRDTVFIEALRARYADAGVFNEYMAIKDEALKRSRRNELVYGLMLLVDVNYRDYTVTMLSVRSNVNFAADVAAAGFSGAAVITANELAKSILAGLAALTVTARSSFDSNYFVEQTSGAWMAVMDGLRADVRSQIDESLQSKSTADYPLERAMVDVYEYYRAGTLARAVGAVTTGAALKKESVPEAKKE